MLAIGQIELIYDNKGSTKLQLVRPFINAKWFTKGFTAEISVNDVDLIFVCKGTKHVIIS